MIQCLQSRRWPRIIAAALLTAALGGCAQFSPDGGMDFVSRDEFEAVKAMAAAARDEVDTLKARLDALEKGGAAGSGSAGPGVDFPA